MTYKYTACTPDKKIISGTLEVDSESLAEDTLYRAGYARVISLKEARPGLSPDMLLPSLFGVRTREIIDFANQLATLVESGISLLTALELLAGQARKKSLQKIMEGLAREIQQGGPLSQAMGRWPRVFPETYRQVVRASEQTGKLEAGLRYAAGYTEKQAEAVQKVRRALLYPAFVLVMAAGVTVLLVTVALPPLVALFQSLGTPLPWMTRFLIGFTGFMLAHKFAILASLIIIIMSIILLLRLPAVLLIRDRYLLKTPVIGTIALERSLQRFCQTISMLLEASLRLPAIMDIVIQADRNRVIREALMRVRDRLIQGEGLARPLAAAGIFPPLLVEMAAVGEKSGAMDTTLAALASFYEKKTDRNIEVIITMIEPVLTVLVGAVVIFIALSVITPLYSILRSVR